MTVIQNLSEEILGDHQAIMDALDARYGSSKPATKNRLRAELQAIRQMETEDLETFADRVFALTVNAHPNYVREEDLQSYAVDAFLNSCEDRNAGLLANVVPPRTISDALDQVKAIQLSSARTGSNLVTRQVSHNGTTSSVNRRHASVSPVRCGTCDGYGHRSKDCANKRRRSPLPFNCNECQGRGHMSFECGNRPRRAGSVERRRDNIERYSRDRGHEDGQRHYSPGQRRKEDHEHHYDSRSFSSFRRSADSPRRSHNNHQGFSSAGTRDDCSYKVRHSSPRHRDNRNSDTYGSSTSPSQSPQGTASGLGSASEHQPEHHLNFQQ